MTLHPGRVRTGQLFRQWDDGRGKPNDQQNVQVSTRDKRDLRMSWSSRLCG